MKLIEMNIDKIFELCRKHSVKSLAVFGSILTDRFNDKSDVDLLVDFNDEEVADSFVNFFDLQEALEGLFARKVDLVDSSSIRNEIFRKEVNETSQIIYG